MKIKNKGKVHPSPSSSSSSSSLDGFVLSVLQLLPAAILALASVLSLDDREVLAYLITRSMKTTPTNASSSSLPQDPKKKSSKKGSNKSASNAAGSHQPMFDCDCFDCYRSYWFKWDTSPSRELIHQAIEAFEDHLTNGEKPKKNAGRGKRRDKLGRREAHKTVDVSAQDDVFVEKQTLAPPKLVEAAAAVLPENDGVLGILAEKDDGFGANDGKVEDLGQEVDVDVAETAEDGAVIVQVAAASSHRGLARKVLPDVLGLLNSRLWNLWSPNV